ncbi:DNA-binding transcriptional regulator of sugar metabolism, DeoR/GlpR family [Paraoerskovia marina]|uniref:DNA-binding transcriptional regulator of sugar metabolism, DeoR/GlpR family n=1 Tax=Paraoerskovia marina TaxID=545619 RepID=A0A1H1UY32_9CELL|nr:DeoR/GlpR family DNA-binding transcription regulator [Paraoerskovia marina]SDS77343.1 DNA-binding transcriptional regulator of sugar metabolism, DeoR/GlpR family [Paraoerskovia marina]
MLAPQRHERLLTMLRADGAVRITDAALALDVSDMTVRRDLAEMAEQGLVRKVHGGAVLPHATTHEPGFEAKRTHSVGEKEAIARAALPLVAPDSAIALSAGTTTSILAGLVAADASLRPLTVVTNSLPVAEILHATGDGQIETILTGGTRTPSDALVGPVAERTLATLHVDVAFVGAHGVGADAGLTTPNIVEGATNAALIAGAGRTVALADHTKWEETGLSRFADLRDLDVLITDDGLEPEAQAAARDLVGELVVAAVAPSTTETETGESA